MLLHSFSLCAIGFFFLEFWVCNRQAFFKIIHFKMFLFPPNLIKTRSKKYYWKMVFFHEKAFNYKHPVLHVSFLRSRRFLQFLSLMYFPIYYSANTSMSNQLWNNVDCQRSSTLFQRWYLIENESSAGVYLSTSFQRWNEVVFSALIYGYIIISPDL